MPPGGPQPSLGPTALTNRPGERSVPPSGVGPEKPPRKRLGLRWAVAGSVALIAVGAIVTHFAPRHTPPTRSVVSGRAGLKKTKAGQIERWFRHKTTVTLDGSLAKLSPAAQDTVTNAFGEWLSSDAKLPRLAFDSRSATEDVMMSPDGENRVYFAPITLAGHEKDLAITLGYTNQDTGEIVEADIIVNSKYPFGLLTAPAIASSADDSKKGDDDKDSNPRHGSSNGQGSSPTTTTPTTTTPGTMAVAGCTSTYDLGSVVTHEAGHFFGLGEDMQDSTTTMYYSTRPCDVHKRFLKVDDTGEVATLYSSEVPGAQDADDGASAQKCSVGSVGRRTNGALTSLAGLALGVVLAGRRRSRAR